MIDTKPGPVVLDVPPRVLGFLNDQWMRPDGRPGHRRARPRRRAAGTCWCRRATRASCPPRASWPRIRLRTYRQWLVLRAFMGPGGDPAPAFENLRGTRIAPLSGDADARADPPHRRHGAVLRHHPPDRHPLLRGPRDDGRLRARRRDQPRGGRAARADRHREGQAVRARRADAGILDEAAQVGSYMAFALTNAPRRDPRRTPDRQWFGSPPRATRGSSTARATADRRHGEHGLVRHRPGERDGGRQAGCRLRLHLGLPRRERRLDRPGAHLSAAAARTHPGQGLLVGGRVRPVDPLDARQRPAVPQHQHLLPRGPARRRRWGDPVHRSRAACRQGSQLDPHACRTSAGSRSSACTARSRHGSTAAWKPDDLSPMDR